jgi:hypothetical protein
LSHKEYLAKKKKLKEKHVYAWFVVLIFLYKLVCGFLLTRLFVVKSSKLRIQIIIEKIKRGSGFSMQKHCAHVNKSL